MCPEDYCGPLCLTKSPDCLTNGIEKFNYTLPDPSEGLINFNGPQIVDCPEMCCVLNNEYCLRLYDNTVNKIEPNQEVMLVFGGITQREVRINGQNIADNCTLARSNNNLLNIFNF